MALNPFDWTAVPFLTLYVTLMVIAFLASLRGWLVRQPSGEIGDAADLTPIELALLAGGRSRAADTVIVGLLENGAASLRKEDRDIAVDGEAARRSRIVEPYPSAADGVMTRWDFHMAIDPAIKVMMERLAQRGLLLSTDELGRLRLHICLLFGAIAVFGLTKIVVGASRGRPVGILVFLVVVTIVLAFFRIQQNFYRSRLGSAVLAASKTENARAARAPIGPELALAFALTGPGVLAGTAYAGYAGQLRSTNGGGGDGGGSSGDGGGSGCGGGGGGGCGGCSG